MSRKILGLSKRNWKCFIVGNIIGWAVALCAIACRAGVPVEFTVETSRADVHEQPCYHGETLDFDVTFKSYGKDLMLPTNAQANIFWQTNGMSAFFWRTNNVTVVSNKMYSTFTPAMDPGTGSCFGFLGIPGVNYRASFVLRFKNSPGAEPKIMEWPYRELDFAKVDMKNEPFYYKEDVDVMMSNVWDRVNEKVDALPTGTWAYMWFKNNKHWYWYYEDSWYVEADDPEDWDVISPGSALGVRITKVESEGIGESLIKKITYKQGFSTVEISLPISEARKIPDVANAKRLGALKSGRYVREIVFDGAVKTTSDGRISINEADPTVPDWAKEQKPIKITDGTNEVLAAGKVVREKEESGWAKGNWRVSRSDGTNFNLTWDERYLCWNDGGGTFPRVYQIGESGLRYASSNSSVHEMGNQPYEDEHVFATATAGVNDTIVYEKGRGVATNEIATVEMLVNATNGVLKTETDPTVQGWAKAATKPAYSAAEVGAYPDASGQMLSAQVATQGAHLNAEDAQCVVTNYDSVTHLREMKLRIKLQEGGTNVWREIWDEMDRWNAFTGTNFNWQSWIGIGAWIRDIEAALDLTSPKEYAFYDGVTGEVAPDGFFWISQPRIGICAGASYQRYLDAGAAVWILESNGMCANVGGTTNGYFRISDEEGNVHFEIVKGDKETVPAISRSVTCTNVMGVTHWYSVYAVTNAISPPVAKFCRDLATQTWVADTEASCPCNVVWTPGVNTYTLEFWPKANEPKMFCKAEYDKGGETKIRQTVPTEMQYIILNGTKYGLVPKTVNGELVMGLTTGGQ